MRDDTDATIIQRAVAGEMAADIVIDKHKSEPARTTYPIRLEAVTVTVRPILDVDAGVAVPGESFTTLVARPRDRWRVKIGPRGAWRSTRTTHSGRCPYC
jgi:hypothetical protein